jgi:aspartyl-tRNA(Asn)/glutamyl-tRNA(Gln) amidotransferase subunit C
VKITRDEAKKIADLAHLAFDDAALDRMASEMTKILTYIDQLAEVAIDETDVGRASARPTPLRDDDVAAQPANPERNAPDWDSGHFVVPKVIGE